MVEFFFAGKLLGGGGWGVRRCVGNGGHIRRRSIRHNTWRERIWRGERRRLGGRDTSDRSFAGEGVDLSHDGRKQEWASKSGEGMTYI